MFKFFSLFFSPVATNFDIFDLYENNLDKLLAVGLTCLGTIVTLPLITGIIWFEWDHHNRTLINQLVSSLMWSLIAWILTYQLLTLLIFIFGPIKISSFCLFFTYSRNALIMIALLLQNAILIIRYIFIFYLKNPTALQDDFWKLFINIWITVFTLLTQFVVSYQPGKHYLIYYICQGERVPHTNELPNKQPIALPALLIVSGGLYIFVRLRTFLFNHGSNHQPLSYRATKTLFSFSANGLGLVSILIGLSFSNVIYFNKMSPMLLNPQIYYFMFLYSPLLVILSITLTFYVKYSSLRSKVFSQILEHFK